MKTTVELFWKEIQEILPSSVDTETGIKLLREFEQAKEMEKMAKKLIQDEWGKDDESLQFGIRVGFREGFEKHAELTADRRFTEDDIKQAYYQGRKDAVNSVTNKLDFINPDDYIKSISQPKSWEVEYK
jgi:hypothetical protein